MKQQRDNSSEYAIAFARRFSERNNGQSLTPTEFAQRVLETVEAVQCRALTPAEGKVSLMGYQILLNQAAIALDYMQMDQDQKLSWRISWLDGKAEQRLIDQAQEPPGNHD